MDKKYFVERYGLIFGTSTFKDTKAAWDALTKEKQNELRQSFRSKKIKEYYETHTAVGRKQTDAEKKKRSESLRRYYETHTVVKTAETIEKQRESIKKYWEDPANIEKQSERLKDLYSKNPEIKDRISDSVKKHWGTYRETPEGQKAIETFIHAPRGRGTSDIEIELQNYVKSVSKDPVILNDRNLLKGKELDIYIPSRNLAVEVDGLVWHCSKFKPDYRTQLSAKTDLCSQHNIRLIHFYDDELREKMPIVKSIIAAALGVYDRKIYARKCEMRELTRAEADKFFNENHLNGTARAQTYYGLTYDGETVQAASFGNNRFSKEKNLELIRMATKLNTQVVGGFSRLMSNVSRCESYIDLRVYDGRGYKACGWTVLGRTKNGYYYTDFKSRFPRQMFMKSSLRKLFCDVDPSKTEEEICREHGYYQIFNCGNLKVLYDLGKSATNSI